MKIYTVLNIEDTQQFVGHVCLFGDSIYEIMAPCPEWDSLLEEVKNYTPLKKRIIAEYQHYLGQER